MYFSVFRFELGSQESRAVLARNLRFREVNAYVSSHPYASGYRDWHGLRQPCAYHLLNLPKAFYSSTNCYCCCDDPQLLVEFAAGEATPASLLRYCCCWSPPDCLPPRIVRDACFFCDRERQGLKSQQSIGA